MSRRKRGIYGRTLADARTYLPSGLGSDLGPGRRWQLIFTEVSGPGDIAGREVHVMLTGRELAAVVGALPAVALNDWAAEDVRAFSATLQLLREQDEVTA